MEDISRTWDAFYDFLMLNIPAMQAAREQREADIATDIAAENLEYCTKLESRLVPPASTIVYATW